MKSRSVVIGISALLFSHVLIGQDRVNANALVQQKFDANVADYMKLRKSAIGDLPPDGEKAKVTILQQQREFADRIRNARPNAKQGDICTAEIAAELRRLISLAMEGENATRIRQSLRSAEPTSVPLQINSTFPDNLPMQSTPPTLLLNLPRLPRELEYRIVGKALVLLDNTANLIADFVPDALPAAK